MSYVRIRSAGWNPIKELNRTDADMSAIYLTLHSILYKYPVDDPLFTAHDSTVLSSSTCYRADFDATVVACADQFQFCRLTDTAHNSTQLTRVLGVLKDTIKLLPTKPNICSETAHRLRGLLGKLTTEGSV